MRVGRSIDMMFFFFFFSIAHGGCCCCCCFLNACLAVLFCSKRFGRLHFFSLAYEFLCTAQRFERIGCYVPRTEISMPRPSCRSLMRMVWGRVSREKGSPSTPAGMLFVSMRGRWRWVFGRSCAGDKRGREGACSFFLAGIASGYGRRRKSGTRALVTQMREIGASVFAVPCA